MSSLYVNERKTERASSGVLYSERPLIEVTLYTIPTVHPIGLCCTYCTAYVQYVLLGCVVHTVQHMYSTSYWGVLYIPYSICTVRPTGVCCTYCTGYVQYVLLGCVVHTVQHMYSTSY